MYYYNFFAWDLQFAGSDPEQSHNAYFAEEIKHRKMFMWWWYILFQHDNDNILLLRIAIVGLKEAFKLVGLISAFRNAGKELKNDRDIVVADAC